MVVFSFFAHLVVRALHVVSSLIVVLASAVPLRDACLSCQCQTLPALVPRMILALVLLLLSILVMSVAEALPFCDPAVKVHWTWARPWLQT